MAPPAVGLLPYTVNQNRIAIFLWRHDFTSLTKDQSAVYWSEMVCEQTEDDPSAISAGARIFSERTSGCMFKKKRKDKRKVSVDVSVADSTKHFLGVLKKRTGTIMLFRNSYPVYVFPVKYVKPSKLSSACNSGSGEWVWFSSLVSNIKSPPPALEISNIENSQQLSLYIKFRSLLHESIETFEELSDVVKEMKIALISEEVDISPRSSAVEEKDEAISIDKAEESTETPDVVYLCKRCRKQVFSELELTPHDMGYGHKKNAKHKKVYCGSWFLDENSPLVSSVTGNEGKLECPNCYVKIGHFEYYGAQCSCGKWITPAIQVPKSKVDVKFLTRASTIPILPTARPIIRPKRMSEEEKDFSQEVSESSGTNVVENSLNEIQKIEDLSVEAEGVTSKEILDGDISM